VLWTAIEVMYLPDALLATVTKLRMGDRGIGVLFPAEAKDVFLESVRTGSVAYLASYSIRAGG
jgi:hypothetical protein